MGKPNARQRGASKPAALKSPSDLGLASPDPWPEPVNGAKVLDEAVQQLTGYLALPDNAAEAIALWCLHAHVVDAMTISPRLAIVSPEKQCGKTTLLALVSHLVPRPLVTSNVTGAAVFRTVEACRPTLLIDEADTFLAGKEELRGILNSGHNKRMGFVVRLVGDQHEPKRFSTWGAVAMAAIRDLPDTLMDRSVVIRMRRRLPAESVWLFRADRTQGLDDVAQKMARFGQDAFEQIAKADPIMPTGLPDRAQDNWRPLLAIADVAGSDWPTRARRAAIAMTGRMDETSIAVQLLEDVYRVFEGVGQNRVTTEYILERLHDMQDRRWPEWRDGKPLSPMNLAFLLRPFGVKPVRFRPSADTAPVHGYELEPLAEAVGRYTQGRIVPASGRLGRNTGTPLGGGDASSELTAIR